MGKLDNAPTIRFGDRNEWVTYLQQLLSAAGFPPATIDSHFDADTLKALNRWQDFHPMARTKVVDHGVWDALYRAASTMESIDDHVGALVGADDANRPREFAVGEEVGQAGWCRTDVAATVHDWLGRPHTGAAYARFVDAKGRSVDESATVTNGSLHFPDVWVPVEGHFSITIAAVQRLPLSLVQELAGVQRYRRKDGTLTFEIKQQPTDPVTYTAEEAHDHGITSETTLEAGFDVEIVSSGGDLKSGSSYGDHWERGSSVTVRFPTEALVIVQTG